jgi:hypothetical protein
MVLEAGQRRTLDQDANLGRTHQNAGAEQQANQQ